MMNSSQRIQRRISLVVLSLFISFAGLSIAQANLDPVAVQAKLQSDLEATLARVLPREKFVVQVNVESDVVNEKVLVEGETVSQVTAPPPAAVVVPPLPGFNPEPSVQPPPNAPSGQTRQVYKTVEKPVLKQIRAQVLIDETLSADAQQQVRSLVETTVRSQFGGKGSAIVTPIKMMAPVQPESSASPWMTMWPWVLLGVLGFMFFVLLAAIAWFLLRSLRRRQRMASREIGNEAFQAMDPQLSQNGRDVSPLNPGSGAARLTGRHDQAEASALPTDAKESKRGFLPLPARESFADSRSELLNLFLLNAEIFRLYFMRLSDAARVELYAALRGPAFDSLMESLDLKVPKEGETSTPPSEDQMIFYHKNFGEFIQTHKWQQQQFFGFLHQLTNEQLLALTRGENALVGSVLVKFMRPEQSAYVMEHLLVDQRQEIVRQISRIKEMGASELSEIERAIRATVENLPNFILTSSNEEVNFWARILAHSENQDDLLIDLERSQPELYEKLAKYRFKLEDLPALPPPLVRKVIGETDNDELTKALLTLPDDLIEYVFNEVEARRLVQLRAQLVSYTGLPPQELREARNSLTTKFREVMA